MEDAPAATVEAPPNAETTTTVTPAPEPEAKPERKDPPDENLVGEAKRRQQRAEREARELRQRVEELEDRDKTELEKAQKRAQRAEESASQYEERIKGLERGGWLRAAAAKAGFNDPDDAVAFSNLDEIEDAKSAERQVTHLAKTKPHLVKADDAPPREIGKVLQGGQPVTPGAAKAADEQTLRHQEASAVLEAIKAAQGRG